MSSLRRWRRQHCRCAVCGEKRAQLVAGRWLCQVCASALSIEEECPEVIGIEPNCTCGQPGCRGTIVVRVRRWS